MTDTTNEPEPEPEPVEAVEAYPNDIYKIRYTVFTAKIDEDDDPHLNLNNKVSFLEVTEKPIECNEYDEETEWGRTGRECNVNVETSCCSRSFVEYVEKAIKTNKTEFPPMIYVGGMGNVVWVILDATKIN